MKIGDREIPGEIIWSMPNRYTFKIKPIMDLIREEAPDFTNWIDPFAGKFSPVPALNQNDLDLTMPALNHLDALAFLKQIKVPVDDVLFDPPYSLNQARRKYGRGFSNKRYWSQVKNEIARIVCVGGKVISCGWEAFPLGINRGFEPTRILLITHGVRKRLNNGKQVPGLII